MTHESDWMGGVALAQSRLHEAVNAAGLDCSVHGYGDRAEEDGTPRGVALLNTTKPEGTPHMPEIEIDAAVIGAGLGIEPALVQAQLQDGRIKLLCERGTGGDRGTFRVSFHFGKQSLRLLVDAAGTLLQRETRDADRAQASHWTSQPIG